MPPEVEAAAALLDAQASIFAAQAAILQAQAVVIHAQAMVLRVAALQSSAAYVPGMHASGTAEEEEEEAGGEMEEVSDALGALRFTGVGRSANEAGLKSRRRCMLPSTEAM